ncbi:Pilus modification protein PilV [Burkholderiales bacterium]|nr:Pilus modification protein PilV [Burkholderiales bacterium]
MCSNRLPVRSIGARPGHGGARGYLLIEVLVSIIVISIGLLGLAQLHAVAVARGTSGLLRSKATELGYAMADRIRANQVGASAGAYANLTGVPSDPGCITASCTPAQLAAYDYFEWNQEIAAALPGGSGVVCIDNTPDDGTPVNPACDGIGTMMVAKVFWSEKGQLVPSYFVTPVRP